MSTLQAPPTVAYTLRRSYRARRLRIAVDRNGSVVVTVPARVSQRAAEGFVEQKRSWIQRTVEYVTRNPVRSVKNTLADFLRMRQAARTLVEHKIRQVNTFYQFIYSQISIRNQSTRWGSCSRKGNLSFNYRIVELPEALAEYLVVHELCHLAELNHSAKFWGLVAQHVSDYRQRRTLLRKIHLR